MALVVLYEQIAGFTLHPREGVVAPSINSMNNIFPDIRGLGKYFTLRNPRWIDQHAKDVTRRRGGVETEAPKPSKRNSCCTFDNDAGFAFNGTPILSVIVLLSAEEPTEDTIERAK